MDDGLGPIEIEFLINNPQLATDAATAEATLQGVAERTAAASASASAAISKLIAKGGYSDNQAEVDAFVSSLSTIGPAGRVAITAVDENIRLLNADLASGAITAEEFRTEIELINKNNADWAATTSSTTDEQKKQLGVIEELTITLENLNALKIGADAEQLPILNKQIQATEAELTKFNNVGKVGFDEYGQKIKAANVEIEQELGLIGQLKAELVALEAEHPSITDPVKLSQANLQIQNLRQEIGRASNMGKVGFDELGNALPTEKTSKFSAALSRATDIGNIAARSVTMFTRQLVGMGVGFLSFEIGAKAIERLVKWVENLDYFTGRLDQAKQNMIALNEVMKDADKEAGKDIGNLEVLYKTATDVTRSTQDRVQAAKDLKATYPEAFANSSMMAIMNGQESGSYRQLTADIYAAAKAKAAQAKIEKLASDQLDAQWQIDQNNFIKKAKLDQAAADYKQDKNSNQSLLAIALQRQSADPSLNIVTPGTSINSAKELYEATVKAINATTNQENLKPSQDAKIMQGQIDSLMHLAGGASKAGEALKKANELLGPNLANFNNLVKNASQEADLENIKKALQVKLDSLAPNDSQIGGIRAKLQQVDDLIKKSYQVKASNPNANNESLKQRAALLQQISQAEDLYNQKSLSKDDAALTAIENKYNDLRVKIAAFNADPKNAKNKIGAADIAKINTTENADVDNQANLNENAFIQADIDKKKKLYEDYQRYKEKLGKDAADAEYKDLLQSGDSFQTYLSNINKSIQADDQTGPIQQRRELVKKASQEDLVQQQVTYEKLLEGVKTYQTERSALTARYEDDRQVAMAKGNTELAAQLDIQYKTDLGRLDDSNFEKLTAVRELLSGTKDLTISQVQAVVDAVTAELATATGLTEDELKRIKKALKDAQKQIDDTVPDLAMKAGSMLQSIGQDIGALNAGLGGTLSALGKIVSEVGTMSKSFSDFKEAQKNKDTAGEITSGLGFVGAAVGIITSVVGFFKAAHDSAVQAAQELKTYQDGLLDGQVKYNELLRDQERSLTDISKLSLDQLKIQQQALALQQQQAQADEAALLAQIQASGQQITGEHTQKYGGFLGIGQKTKVVQDLAGVGDAGYDQLLALFTQGKLDQQTAAWFQELQNVHNELQDIGTSAQAAADQLNQIATGTTAQDIANSIVQGFEAGKRTAADFASDFKSLMQNAAVSVFESNYLAGKITDFYNQFAAASASDGGLTPDKIAQLKAAYAKVIGDAGVQFDNLEKVVGVISGTQQNSATLTGQVSGITADQANILVGAIDGLRLTNLLTNQILTPMGKSMEDQTAELRTQTLLQMQIAANTKRTADNTDTMKDSLKNIDSNTSSSSLTNVLRAAGKI